jgi:cytoskeletal protein CcmA (bactofilin family)
MWKRAEPSSPGSVPASPEQAPPSFAEFDPLREEPGPVREAPAGIGTSIVVNGQLTGAEDLTVEGRVEGKIELRDHVLTVGPNGHIKAQVLARVIVVLGRVTGNLTATEKIDIRESGSVEGDMVAPRVAIADGSHFRGSIDMQEKDQPAKPSISKPEPASVNGEAVHV